MLPAPLKRNHSGALTDVDRTLDVAGDVLRQGVALSGRFPYLAAGDVVTMSIDRLGRMQQQVRPATD